MKKVILGIVGILIIVGAVAGNGDKESSERKISKSSVSTSVTTTVVNTTEETKKDDNNETEYTYGDPELKITYSRPSGSPPIRLGNSGDEVGWVQEALNKAMNAGISVNCSFEQGTESKVISFQSRCGLEADGIVGPLTIATLVDIISGNRTMPPEVVQVATDSPVRSYNNDQIQQSVDAQTPVQSYECEYIVNTNTGKFHYPTCSQIHKINEENKWYYYGNKEDLINQGYTSCGKCNP